MQSKDATTFQKNVKNETFLCPLRHLKYLCIYFYSICLLLTHSNYIVDFFFISWFFLFSFLFSLNFNEIKTKHASQTSLDSHVVTTKIVHRTWMINTVVMNLYFWSKIYSKHFIHFFFKPKINRTHVACLYFQFFFIPKMSAIYFWICLYSIITSNKHNGIYLLQKCWIPDKNV